MRRKAFTLTELLFVMMIVGILAALVTAAVRGSTQQARIERTRAVINRLDKLITEKYESYRTRAVPIRIQPGTQPPIAAMMRLNALRELMRMEMPDRQTDVQDAPVVLSTPPALWKQYRRRAVSSWSTKHEGAECLYLIVAAMRDGEDSALDFFTPSEIGDSDADGMNEIWDAFGQPIEFIRWPAGYVTENGPVTDLTSDYNKAPDVFDPMKVDRRQTFTTYHLRPLVYSPGPDKEYHLNAGTVQYSQTTPPNDPYYGAGGVAVFVGTPTGTGAVDNITSHDLTGDK
jgi:prepilin-type N-terminal cleavage/methylation domain-containing protein